MFKIGDKLFYGKIGVCEITDISEKEIIKNKKEEYYVLNPLNLTNSTIYAPVDSNKVPMRYLMSRNECNALIQKIPEIIKKFSSDTFSEEEFKKKFDYQNPEDLVLLTSFIYDKKKSAILNKKRLGFADERFMKQGESLLFGEISEALSIPIGEVEAYIKSRIK